MRFPTNALVLNEKGQPCFERLFVEAFGVHFGEAVQLAGEFEVVGCLFVGGEGVVVCPGFADEEKGGVGGVGEEAVADAALFLLGFFDQGVGGGDDFFPFFGFYFDEYV